VLAFIFIIALQMIGMLLHRILTLGHIVASTHLVEKKDELKNCVDIIKDFQKQLEPDDSGKTMEERTIDEINNIDDNTIRRMSSTDTGKKLLRRETVKALRGGAKKFEGRRQTVRNRRTINSKPNYSTINEDEEQEQENIPVIQL